MNLYLISQSVNNDYDTYDSAVVAAESENDARFTRPDKQEWRVKSVFSSWCGRPEDVTVELIGTAKAGTPARVILASFNAG